MSEADNTWRTDVSGTEYEIQFEHSMTGKYSFKVDGELVDQGRQWGFGTKTEEFEVGPQRAKISLYPKYGGLGWGSSLHLDGRYVEPLRRSVSASARRGVRERSRGVTRGTLQICLAGLLILGGCGSDDSGQSTSSPQATVTQTVQATAPSRTTSVKSQTKLCPTEQLKISVADGGAGLGHSGLILRFKNEGKRCTTRGYPGVNALMANGHVVDRARRSRSGYLGGAASGPRRISLRTGETASALLEGLSDSRSGGRCPAYRSLKITPPDETHSVLRSQHPRYSICDLQIHPLLPGRSGSER